jgi:hypothetical protein
MKLEVLKEYADDIAERLVRFHLLSKLEGQVQWLDENESPTHLQLNFLHDEVDKVIKLWDHSVMTRILEEERFLRMRKD